MITAAECKTYAEFVEKYQWYVYPVLSARISRIRGHGSRAEVAIDMGTGPGHLTAYLARDHAQVVHAVDVNPAMHEIARVTCERLDPPGKIFFDLADVHDLPYPDGHADLVVSYSCFHHWADPVRGLEECLRVLRPGGLLYLTDTDGARRDAGSIIEETVVEPEYFRFVAEAFEESVDRSAVAAFVQSAGVPEFTLRDFALEEEDVMAAIDDLAPGRPLPAVGDKELGAVSWELVIRKPR